jgi:hypothetical protein
VVVGAVAFLRPDAGHALVGRGLRRLRGPPAWLIRTIKASLPDPEVITHLEEK